MKVFNSLVNTINRMIFGKSANKSVVLQPTKAVRPLVTKHIPIGMDNGMAPTQMVICGGAPIPCRTLNQKQKRKLYRQIH